MKVDCTVILRWLTKPLEVMAVLFLTSTEVLVSLQSITWDTVTMGR